MKYSKDEVLQFISEEDVKFVRLSFCDVFGNLKNIAVVASELPRAFESGIAFDASSIAGFGDEARSDLFLWPEPDTLSLLPWRPEHGRVVKMFCQIRKPDGAPFENDPRLVLLRAVDYARSAGFKFTIGSEQEFYLFKADQFDMPTNLPYDSAGYMDVYPEDRGENIRREICLTLEQMGFRPESSHHEEGPGQNEVDFRFSDPLAAADNTIAFRQVVKTIARRNGLYANFGAKPLDGKPGNGFHVNISLEPAPGAREIGYIVGGILDKLEEITLFLNPTECSYKRLGKLKAPRYVAWSNENRSEAVRIPAAQGEFRRAELRSPDPSANPYLVFALLIYAAVDGLEKKMEPPEPADLNLYKASAEVLAKFRKLPEDLNYARALAKSSGFVRQKLPRDIIEAYCR